MACGHGLLITKWVIRSCPPLMKEENFNNLCETFYFVIEFELQESKDLVDSDWVLGFEEVMVYG